jgi:hypothetical protein
VNHSRKKRSFAAGSVLPQNKKTSNALNPPDCLSQFCFAYPPQAATQFDTPCRRFYA